MGFRLPNHDAKGWEKKKKSHMGRLHWRGLKKNIENKNLYYA